MNKKILFIGILVLVFSFIACDQGTGNSPKSVALSTLDFNTVGSGCASDLKAQGWRDISVKFNVKNGGSGLTHSYGVVGTPDESSMVKDGDYGANDFTIHISIPENTTYLNIFWSATPMFYTWFYSTSKMNVNSSNSKYEIVFDYNGEYHDNSGNPRVHTTNLYDWKVGRDDNMKAIFEAARAKAVQDKD